MCWRAFFSPLGCGFDCCHLLVGDIIRAQPPELVPGWVTESSRIHPPERFSTAETEKASVDKSDKNAVFYLNSLPVSEDAECPGRVSHRGIFWFTVLLLDLSCHQNRPGKGRKTNRNFSSTPPPPSVGEDSKAQWKSRKWILKLDLVTVRLQTTADCVASQKNPLNWKIMLYFRDVKH